MVALTNKLKNHLATAAILMLSITQGSAQKEVVRNEQLWFQYAQQFQFAKRLSLHSDVSFRFIGGLIPRTLRTLRTGVRYRITSGLHGITGLAVFSSYRKEEQEAIELRIYQELSTAATFGRVKAEHRFRAEARFIGGLGDGPRNTSFNWRMRYRLLVSVPLMTWAEKHPERALLFNFGDEVFINVDSQIKYNMLDNNRLLTGFTFERSEKMSLTGAYIWQFGQRDAEALYESSNIATLIFSHIL